MVRAFAAAGIVNRIVARDAPSSLKIQDWDGLRLIIGVILNAGQEAFGEII
jgi:hypothetical protein